MQLARLFERTLDQKDGNDDCEASTPGNVTVPPDRTTPCCQHLMLSEAQASESYIRREVDAIMSSNTVITASPDMTGTAALIGDLQDAGERAVAVSLLAGRPVQYAVCSGTRPQSCVSTDLNPMFPAVYVLLGYHVRPSIILFKPRLQAVHPSCMH
jgi:hypothetical protein